MNKNPISRDFKVLLLSILKKGCMTGTDRHNIENYFGTYFDGKDPLELPQLSSEDLAELVEICGLTIDEVTAAYYERKKQEEKRQKLLPNGSR